MHQAAQRLRSGEHISQQQITKKTRTSGITYCVRARTHTHADARTRQHNHSHRPRRHYIRRRNAHQHTNTFTQPPHSIYTFTYILYTHACGHRDALTPITPIEMAMLICCSTKLGFYSYIPYTSHTHTNRAYVPHANFLSKLLHETRQSIPNRGAQPRELNRKGFHQQGGHGEGGVGCLGAARLHSRSPRLDVLDHETVKHLEREGGGGGRNRKVGFRRRWRFFSGIRLFGFGKGEGGGDWMFEFGGRWRFLCGVVFLA